MPHIERQYEKIRHHAHIQLSKILNKFKKESPQREKTNADVELALAAYSTISHNEGYDALRESVHDLLTRLNKSEMRVVNMLYFEHKTQEDIARIMHVTQQNVSYLHSRAIDKMRSGTNRKPK